MYLDTIEIFRNDIKKIKEDLLLNNICFMNEQNILTNLIVKEIEEDFNKPVYYINKKNFKNQIINITLDLGLIESDNSLSYNNQTLYNNIKYNPNYLNLIKEKVIFQIDDLSLKKELSNISLIIIDKKSESINYERIQSLIPSFLKEINLNNQEKLILVLNKIKSRTDLNSFLLNFDYIYSNIIKNNLTDFQLSLLKSRILFTNKTSSDVKKFTNNKNSSSIINGLKQLQKNNFLDKNLQFKDSIFLLWLINNFNRV